MHRLFVALALAVTVVLSAFLVWHQTWRPVPAPAGGDAAVTEDDGAILQPDGDPATAERVREACEREIVMRSDLPFTEFPRPGTPEYSEPTWAPELDSWVWVVELVYEEGMALRREWECRITGDGQGMVRRNY